MDLHGLHLQMAKEGLTGTLRISQRVQLVGFRCSVCPGRGESGSPSLVILSNVCECMVWGEGSVKCPLCRCEDGSLCLQELRAMLSWGGGPPVILAQKMEIGDPQGKLASKTSQTYKLWKI